MGRKNTRKKVIAASATANPFDIKMNRKKHSILGQKVKGTQGLPGVSRALGHAKRKDFLHQKKIKTQKANRFLDKRLMNDSMPLDEQITSRLVLERKNKLKKSSFQLNDQEKLTHQGIPLNELRNYEDLGNDSDDEEQLSENFVKQAHFGGFSSNSNDETPKSHKEIINELIVDSKKRKQEKKIENEENADLTDKLDQDWKDILSLMSGIKGNKPPEKSEKKDSYDVALQELKYEMRASATSRLKTAEELAIEEENRLKKLETERLQRMTDSHSVSSNNHFVSADSIDDGFDIEPVPVGDTFEENFNDDAKAENSEEENDSSESAVEEMVDDRNYTEVEDKYVEEKELSNKSNDMIPVTKEDLNAVLNDCTSAEMSTAIANILKSNLPCKSEKRLAKLEKFFSLLFEYMNEICENSVEKCTILFPYLYDLAKSSPVKTGEFILSCLDEEQLFFQDSLCTKKTRYSPRVRCLLLLKLCTSLYSVSDFRHPVMTPVFILMCDVLCREHSLNLPNVIRRLFICHLFIHCLSDSKRLAPEVLIYLNKILLLGKKVKKNKDFNLCPHELTEATTNELNLLEKGVLCDDVTKVSIIFKVIAQLQNLAELYSYLPSYKEIFTKSLTICNQLPLNKYPENLKEAIKTFQTTITNNVKPLRHLTYQNTKPKPLKLFEPAFDSKFSLRKNDVSRKRKLVKSVEQKIKKEEKCVLREIRRDAQVVAAERLSEKLEADEERKRKVKQLYQELAVQEGEYKKFAKKNKKL